MGGSGAGRYSAPRGGSARKGPGAARSRYVDTFNTDTNDASTDAERMPPPAAKPKAPPPAYKIFTPVKAAGADADADAGADGSAAATPLFMTPTADVYAAIQPGAEPAAAVDE